MKIFHGLNSADSGNTPATSTDQGSAGFNMAVDFGPGGAAWGNVAGKGRGFNITATSNTSPAKVWAAIGATLAGQLNGLTTGLILLRRDNAFTSTDVVTLARLGSDDNTGTPAFHYERSGAGIWIFALMGFPFTFYNGQSFLAVVFNTAAVTLSDRIKFFTLDETSGNALVQITPDGGYGAAGGTENTIPQNTAISGLTATSQITIGNRPAGNHNGIGMLKCFGFDDTLWTSAAVEAALLQLVDDDDTMPTAGSGDTSLAGAAAGQATATGVLQGVGLEFTLRDIDAGTVKNSVTYARVDVHLASDLSLLKTSLNVTTSPEGLIRIADPLLETLGTNCFVVGWTSGGTDRFHASATVAGFS